VIVLDTTVLVYVTGSEHPFRQPCRRLVESITDGRVAATTTVEVIQEFAHVRARRQGREDAARIAAAFADLLSPLLLVGEDDLREGLRLYTGSTALGAFDAVLAARARSAAADAIVSADGAFAEVPELPHIVPDVAGVERLLGTST
jgi:predicted nucleic acid-binding protein